MKSHEGDIWEYLEFENDKDDTSDDEECCILEGDRSQTKQGMEEESYEQVGENVEDDVNIGSISGIKIGEKKSEC